MTISTYPYDCVCLIDDTIPGAGSFRGSGVIIGPHTILTASHVLWDADAGAGASTVSIFPGYNANSTNEPSSGQLQGRQVLHYYKVNNKGHVLSASASQYDFAIIDTSANLTSYGSFGLTANFTGGAAEVTGYPAAHQHLQYKINGTVNPDVNSGVWDYSNFQSTGGFSGGPIWINKGTSSHSLPYVVGIVSTTNHGVRLTGSDLNTIKAWQASDAYLWSGATSSVNPGAQAVRTGQTLQVGSGDGSSQTYYSYSNDSFVASGKPDTFVFASGFGHDVVQAFDLDEDKISLPQADATRLAAILAHATNDGLGDSILHLGKSDTITIAGATVADLQKHKADFTFHA